MYLVLKGVGGGGQMTSLNLRTCFPRLLEAVWDTLEMHRCQVSAVGHAFYEFVSDVFVSVGKKNQTYLFCAQSDQF